MIWSVLQHATSIAIGVAVVIYFLLLYFIFRRLKTQHVDLWNDLGQPRIISDRSVTHMRSVSSLYRSGKYLSLNDPTVGRLLAGWMFAGRAIGGVFILALIVNLMIR